MISLPDLLPARVVAKVPQALLFISADLERGASLLSVMPTKASQESRQALEAKTLIVGAEDEIPIDCVYAGG